MDLSLNSVCPLLLQSINRRIFEQLLIEHFSETTSTSLSSAEKRASAMNAEEENALCYVGGYVALKLLHKYEKEDGEKLVQFLECLSSMAVVGNESSFYNYTKEWISLIDRGGLFHE